MSTPNRLGVLFVSIVALIGVGSAYADGPALAHVEVGGKGPVPVVLIPGLACDWTVYKGFMERNAKRYTMYAVTLPGFGGSEAPALAEGAKPSDDAWLRNAEAAVAAMVTEKKLDQPVVIGHSLGGHLAFRLAEDHPEMFKAAVALDGAPAFPMRGSMTKENRAKLVDTQVGPQFEKMTDEAWATQTRASAKSMVTDPERAKAIGELCAAVKGKTAGRYMVELMGADRSAELKDLKIPVLEIAAVSDLAAGPAAKSVRKSWQDQFKEAPKVTLVFFEKTRHFVMEDAPAELDTAVEDFLAGREVKGKGEAPKEPVKPEDRPTEQRGK
jgi:pimeloyl-ACP methyl ester carboxylesterase